MRKWRIIVAMIVSMIIAYILIGLTKDDNDGIKDLASEFAHSGRDKFCPESPKIGKKWTSFTSVLRAYKQFHDAQILNMNNSISESCRTLVWSCEGVCSGMGARIRAMEQIFLLSVITNRVFGIYLDDLNRRMMDLYLEPNQIDWYSAFQSATSNSNEYIIAKGSVCNSSLLSLLFSNKTYITVSSQVGNLLHDCSMN